MKIATGKGRFRFWFDFHLAGGLYAAIFLLLFCLTGLTWSFNWYRNGFYRVFGVQTTQGGGHAPGQQAPQQSVPGRSPGDRSRQEGATTAAAPHTGPSEERSLGNGRDRNDQVNPASSSTSVDYSIWDKAVAEVAKKYPKWYSISVQNGSVSVSENSRGNVRASDRYTFDPQTGEITGVQLYKDSDKSTKIRGWIYSVHVGSWGGLFTRVLSFLACLVGAALPISGYWFYIRRRRIARKKAKA